MAVDDDDDPPRRGDPPMPPGVPATGALKALDADGDGVVTLVDKAVLDAEAENRRQVNQLYARSLTTVLLVLVLIMAITGALVWQDAVPAETFTQFGLVIIGTISAMIGGLGQFAIMERQHGKAAEGAG